MINQVLSTNTAQSRAFSDFSQPPNGYYINTPLDPDEKMKNNHKLGKTIAVSALIIGFGSLALLGGGLNKGAAKLLDKWKVKLEQKMAEGGNFKDFYKYALEKVDSFILKTESINNLTSLKDVACQKLMCGNKGGRKYTRKIHEGITGIFQRISRKRVNSSYAKTHKKFAGLSEYFTSINERILREHPDDSKIINLVNNIDTRIKNVNSNFEKGFGINARKERLQEINKATEGLPEFLWDASFKDVKNFKSKNMWQTFIADGYIMPAKMQLANKIALLRRTITHDINDNCKVTVKALNNIKKLVNPSDAPANNILNDLRNNIAEYKKLSGKPEIAKREVLNKEIAANLHKLADNFTGTSSRYNYNSDTVKLISSYVKEVDNIISRSSKGELQEILALYRDILSENEYLKLQSKVESAIKSLDKSIEIETVRYVDKARDLKLGSAPTDILSIIGTVGTVGYYLNKADSKDDRYSVSLRYGIPVIGAIATSLYCTARLIAGGKALLFGLVSGWVINKIGAAVDDARKKYSLDVSFHRRDMKDLFKPQSDKV